MPRHPRALLVAATLSLGAPSVALAQDASSQAAAQALFEQARHLMADGKYAEACPKLVESQRLDPGAGTLLNLGACYEKNGQTASAWVTFKDAAASAEQRHRADWTKQARERAQALEPLLAKLTIDVPVDARAAGLQVRRDGVDVGTAVWGTPIPVDPGDHTLEAVAPAKKRWTTVVNVRPRDLANVVVPSLADDPAPSAAVVPPPVVPPAPIAAVPSPPPAGADVPSSSDGSTQRTVGLITGGVGVAGVVVGSIFGGIALSKASASKTDCPSSPCPATAQGSQGFQENSDSKSAANVSTIALIAGGALVATGAVVYLVAPRSRSQTAIHVGPAVGAGEVGLRLGGAW